MSKWHMKKYLHNLSDYESREVELYKNDFYAEIERIANEKGIELPDTSWKIEIDVSGTTTLTGTLQSKKTKNR